jgi:hypothetical protein
MNKTELAIEHFSYGISHDIYSEPVTTYAKLAVEALEEKAERDKGCVWCKEDNKVFHDGQHFHMFCSYCGKRLEVKHEAD